MKRIIIASVLLGFLMAFQDAQAQILKGFGKKLEQKIEQRIERKADRQVDKVLDKADKKTDESLDQVLNNSEAKASKKNKKNSDSGLRDVVSRPDQALVLMGSNCSDFSWFSKGAVLEYEAFDSKGKLEGGLKMQVLDLQNKGSATLADVRATMSSPNFEDIAYSMVYICDGDQIYMDIASMMKAMMEKNPALNEKRLQESLNNLDFEIDQGFASFPKKMYPGMKLEDLSFGFTANVAGNEMAFRTLVVDRQVLSRETVTTKAGTFDCLKIRSVSKTSIAVMGVNQKMPENTEYLWIAPGIGMVKQETHSKDKKGTSIQLKTLKL